MTMMMSNTLSNFTFPGSAEPNWGPNGKVVYERTYQRTVNGVKETWDDTVRRVIKGNTSLVPGNRIQLGEEEELYDLLYNFRAIPGGRHLWMSGVEGKQFLFNCYVSGWGDRLSDHFRFTFNQLMEGGGVGANYSSKYVNKFKVVTQNRVHIVCSPLHPDYESLKDILSTEYDIYAEESYLVSDSREGWVGSLGWLIDRTTDHYFEPLDLVFDVSNVREAGSLIKSFGGTAAGPAPLAKMLKEIGHSLNEAFDTGFSPMIAMEMDHAIANCVVSGNVRRSARMSQMHWADPAIHQFLECKRLGGHWSTNISVEIDDEFVALLNTQKIEDDPRETQAWNVYQAIIQGMLENGEPGFWNSSYSNEGEPNRVIATNPCGEICLEEWENCNLGHINLSAFVDFNGGVDSNGILRAHELMARFLIRATFGDISDKKTQAVVSRNRRIGVGHLGFADFCAMTGIKYSKSHENSNVIFLLKNAKAVVDKACSDYAHELRIPVPVKNTTIAPTGTISKLPGVNGEGIHPLFARYYIQRIRFSTVDYAQRMQLEEYVIKGYSVVPDPKVPNTMVVEIPMKSSLLQKVEDMGWSPSVVEDAHEISLSDLLKVQQMYQYYYADNAVSFTANVNPLAYTPESLGREMLPFLGTLKGSTIFPERGYELAPYERVPQEVFSSLSGHLSALNGPTVGDAIDENCATGACPVR